MKKVLPLVLLVSLVVFMSGCTITIDETGDGTVTDTVTEVSGTEAEPITSAYVSSVVITSIHDSVGNVLYSGAFTGEDLLTVEGQVVATGDVSYSTVLSQNGIEQFVAVDSSGVFTTYVSIMPGENTFQIIVRSLEGEIIGRSSEYSINTLEVTTEEGEITSSQATDLRVTLTWDTDENDIDLHVIDPNNCETYYGDKYAIRGAELDVDDVDGFGPEIFTLNDGSAVIGDYEVVVNYFSEHGVTRPVTATVRVQTDEGTVQTYTHTFTSSDVGEDWNVGSFQVSSATNQPTDVCSSYDYYDNYTYDYVYIDTIGYAYYDGDYTYENYDSTMGNLLYGHASEDVYSVEIYVDGALESTVYTDAHGSFSTYLDLEAEYNMLVELYAYDSSGAYLAYDYWHIDVYSSTQNPGTSYDYVEIDQIGYAYSDGDYTYEDYDGAMGNLLEGTASVDIYSVEIYVDGDYETVAYPDSTGYFSAYLDLVESTDSLVELYAYDSSDAYLAYDYWYIDVYEDTSVVTEEPQLTNISSLEITGVGDLTSSGGTITTSNNLVSVTGTVVYTGTLEEDVILYVNDVPQYVSVEATGLVSESAILYAGTNTLRLAAVDAAGTEVATSTTWTVTTTNIASSDMVVVLTWDTDYDDMDLHVVGPTDIDTYYSNMNTADGELDVDDVEGYGPETFTLSETASSGDYDVRIYYYDNDGTGTALEESSRLTVTITTDAGSTTYYHTFAPEDESTYWDVATVTISS